MPNFSKLDFITRDDMQGNESDLCILQADIDDGNTGGIKFAYASGSAVVAIGSEFTAFNASGQDLTSGTAAVFGRDSNKAPFSFKRGGSGGGGGTENAYFKLPDKTISVAVSAADGSSDNDSASATYTFSSVASVYGYVFYYSRTRYDSTTGTYTLSNGWSFKLNSSTERPNKPFANSTNDTVADVTLNLTAGASVTSLSITAYASATTSGVGSSVEFSGSITIHAISFLSIS